MKKAKDKQRTKKKGEFTPLLILINPIFKTEIYFFSRTTNSKCAHPSSANLNIVSFDSLAPQKEQ